MCSVLPGMIFEVFRKTPSILSGLAHPWLWEWDWLSKERDLALSRQVSYSPASSLPLCLPCIPWGGGVGIRDPHPPEAQLGKNKLGSFKSS